MSQVKETNSSRNAVIGLLATLGGFVGWKLLQTQKEKKIDCTIKVGDLFIYPIKSCKGTKLNECELTNTGLKHDREWMIYTISKGKNLFVTQRELPCIALISPKLSFDDKNGNVNGLYLNAPNMESLFVPIAQETSENFVSQVKIWRHFVVGTDQGTDASKWLSKYINNYRETQFNNNNNNNNNDGSNGKEFEYIEYRLLKLCNDNPNRTSFDYIPKFLGGKMKFDKKENENENDLIKTHSSFSDAMPILVASQSSLNEVNRRLLNSDKNEKRIKMDRFRPNIVIYGTSNNNNNNNNDYENDKLPPFYEDDVKYFTNERNNITFYLTKPCSRCSMPTIDQQTMEKNENVRSTLQSFRTGKQLGLTRKSWQDANFFGMNACNDKCGNIKIGDILT